MTFVLHYIYMRYIRHNKSSQIQSITHIYILADIVMDKEPSLNATTACTFPCGSSKKIEENDIDVSTLPSATKPAIEKYHSKDVKKFIGQYGNFAAGNLTVTVNDTLEGLVVNFDAYSCLVLLGTVTAVSVWVFFGFLVFGELNLMRKIIPVNL